MFFPPPSHDPEAGPSRSDLWRVANLLLDAGLTIDEVEQRVVERGGARPFARTLLGDVLAARQRAVDTNPAPRPGPARGGRAIGGGALWLLGGALVTTLSCVLVAPGGSYLVASGAMLYGAIQIARGAGQVMGPDRTPVMDPAARPRPTGDPAPAGPELV